ncbi:MAG: hypothetical protein U1E22_10345, partial [Coriobacteriia bacterium]|nr:hypothetical protein [Coriobacteriia bacterium]
ALYISLILPPESKSLAAQAAADFGREAALEAASEQMNTVARWFAQKRRATCSMSTPDCALSAVRGRSFFRNT